MIHSGQRKLALSGWLKENRQEEYNSPLKLQKYLFFYEAFSKTHKEVSDFHGMCGYTQGPVFSDVWDDYMRERKDFDLSAKQAYQSNKESICVNRAKISGFLVTVLSEKDLSTLTRRMNIWKRQKNKIAQELYPVSLNEEDFDEHDQNMMRTLEQMYPVSLIDKSCVIKFNNFRFIFNEEDIPQLTVQHFDTLCFLSQKRNIHNPVFVEIDEEGRLVVE